jgi:hypothetical protein
MTGMPLPESLQMGPIISTDVDRIPDIVALGAGDQVPLEISPGDLVRGPVRMLAEPEWLGRTSGECVASTTQRELAALRGNSQRETR